MRNERFLSDVLRRSVRSTPPPTGERRAGRARSRGSAHVAPVMSFSWGAEDSKAYATVKSKPPPAENKSGVIGVIKRLDGTVEEVTNMSYIKSNPNFAPRKTEWGNNVTSNKDEALIKYHERKGLPLPAELQVSGCSSRLARASRPILTLTLTKGRPLPPEL